MFLLFIPVAIPVNGKLVVPPPTLLYLTDNLVSDVSTNPCLGGIVTFALTPVPVTVISSPTKSTILIPPRLPLTTPPFLMVKLPNVPVFAETPYPTKCIISPFAVAVVRVTTVPPFELYAESANFTPFWNTSRPAGSWSKANCV